MAKLKEVDQLLKQDEFVQRVADKTDGKYTAKQVRDVAKLVYATLGEVLAEGRKVQLSGLGTFSVRFRKGRQIKVPFTGEKKTTADTAVAAFKTSAGLKKALAGNADLVKALAKLEKDSKKK